MNLLFLVPLILQPAGQSLSAQAVMDKVRQATAYESRAKMDVLMQGTASSLGLSGGYSLRLSPEGKYVYQIRTPLGRTVGYDGRNVWEADRSGATRILSFGEAETELATGSIITNAWLDPKSKVQVTLGEQNSPDTYTLNLKMAGGELDKTLTIDAKTWLPREATYQSSAGQVVVKLEEWGNALGQKLPHKTTISAAGVSDSMRIYTHQRSNSGSYAMPQWTPRDVSFDRDVPNTVETKRLPSGHIIVNPRVNGKDIGWFILDSGAEAMCIDTASANELGLPSVGKVPAVGVGGVVLVPFRTSKDFSLGPAAMQNVVFVELDLAQISKALGLRLGGIIGYDLFRRTVIEMDVAKPEVKVYEPRSYRLPEGSWTPIRFDGGNIGVEARFEGDRTGWFRVDTGASGTVSFHGPFVERFELLKDREVTKVTEGGVGGMVEARKGRIDFFELGGHRFERPFATFSLSKVGAFYNKWLVGNIGQDFMNPFKLVFDYPNSRMAFVKR